MDSLQMFFSRLKALFLQQAQEQELEQELQTHLDLLTDRYLRQGMDLKDARAAAERQFGKATLLKEDLREQRAIVAAESLFQDIRYALRQLRKSPGFSLTALLTIALGIGANTAIFSLVNALTLKSLPVSHPEELFQVMMGKQSYMGFTNPTWEHLRDRQDVFSGIFAYGGWAFNLAAGGQARSVHGNYVSGQYFDTLGARALLGRTLKAADDTRGCPGSAILSYGFWQSEYGGRADILGKPISVDRHPIEIVGVTEPGFNGTEVGGSADVTLPLCAIATIGSGRPSMLDINFYPVGWLQVMGRLKHGISASQAKARLKTLAPQIYKSALDQNGLAREDGRQLRPDSREDYLRRTFDIEPAGNGISYLRRQYAQALNVLMAIVGLVLLIACANVANLLLARGASRQREIAIRLAIGVSQSRLIRQLLTESLVLSGVGALVGVVFAEWGAHLLVRFLKARLDITVDVRVLAFTAGVAVLTGLFFGIAPAWRGSHVDPQSAMKANARGLIEGSKLGFGQVLVITQLALSLLLVVGAALMISTFWKLISLDAGFDRNHVLLVSTDLRAAKYPPERWSAVYQEMLDQLRIIPGVHSASVSSITPVCHCRWAGEVAIEGYTLKSHEDAVISFNDVSDGYFETIGTSIIAGRDFNTLDTSTSLKVAIVSQSMARKYFGTANPLGRHFRLLDGGITNAAPVEIIGIVKDARYGSLRDEPTPFAFIPWSQGGAPGPLSGFELRSAAGSPTNLISGVKSAIARVNPDVSIEFQTLSGKVDDSIQRETLLATLSGFFGVLTLVLASIGLYGVMSYNVTRRHNEIGIRLALGAERSQVLRMVLTEVVMLIAIGLLVGFGMALATTRMVASFLYGLQPNNPWTLGAAAALLAIVATMAGYLPARRASQVDPMIALREE
jgi:putative ABC transport system permease protein